MATKLDVIYSKFLNQIDDIELGLVEEEDLEDMLLDYLENATVEFWECKKDLSIKKPERTSYTFKSNQNISVKTPFNEYTTVVVKDQGRVYVLDKDYSLVYQEENGQLDINTTTSSFGNIEVDVCEEGYINDDLTLEEIYILSLCMVISWLSPKILREENLKQTTTDRDFKQLSNANMLNRLIGLSKMARNDLQRYRQNYSYKDFKGYD